MALSVYCFAYVSQTSISSNMKLTFHISKDSLLISICSLENLGKPTEASMADIHDIYINVYVWTMPLS